MEQTTSAPHQDLLHFAERVDRRLDGLFGAAIGRAEAIDPAYAELLGVAKDQLLRRGKRLRPYVTFTALVGLGGPDSADAVAASASQELFHHFLLLHDDVMDRDLVRHGGPNVAGVYAQRFADRGAAAGEALHFASAYAILAGNACCALGLEAILDTGFAPDRKLEAMRAVQRMLFEEMGGQLTDISLTIPEAAVPTLAQLLKVARYKTACYTFETPLRVASTLTAADPATCRGLDIFGRCLGVAFQLADDLLGVYGTEAMLGKPVLSDLHEGKHTVLVHFALRDATPAQARRLRSVWGKPAATMEDLETARGVFEATRARERVRELAGAQVEAALAALEATALSAAAKQRFTALARFSVQRQY